MKDYIYQNNLISKKQLRQILSWSFTHYDSMQACALADELKYLGFQYATKAGISISIEDLRIPFVKNLMLEKANQEIIYSEKIYLKGKITDVERFQKIISVWGLTSEALKDQVVHYFKRYDPLNSVYIMAFSGARGNLSQVRQLVGMRGLMSDPSGEIMNLPIKKNFREGLTITDYLMSGYGARKGIVDTALKTANSGYLTRRLIDVAQDILIREKDCNTNHSFIILNIENLFEQALGRVLNLSIFDPITLTIIAQKNTQITPTLINTLKYKNIPRIYIRSPLTCKLYRALCQQCYGWDLANQNLVDIGEAIGILAGQSIGEPGTQLTMRTFHTGGIFTSKTREKVLSPSGGILQFSSSLKTVVLRTNRGEDVLVSKNLGFLIIIPVSQNEKIRKVKILRNTILFPKHNQFVRKGTVLGEIIDTDTQIKQEIKPILATTSGEVIVPKLKNRLNNLNNNKLLWVLSGELFNSPLSSYINFNLDYKLNKDSFIFRTKIVNSYPGRVISKNKIQNLYERNILIKNEAYSLQNSEFLQLSSSVGNANSLLKFRNSLYLIYTAFKNSKTYLKLTRKKQFGRLISNIYKTKTGGTIYYDWRGINYPINSHSKIYFPKHAIREKIEITELGDVEVKTITHENQKFFSRVFYRTLIWLEEETCYLNCEQDILLVTHSDFIRENFEIVPNEYSKTSGLILVEQKNNFVETVTVKSGLLYEGTELNEQYGKVYFPGEQIFPNILIDSPSLCEHILGKNGAQLLIRPIQLYEFPSFKTTKNIFKDPEQIEKILELETGLNITYLSKQEIQTKTSINLASEVINLEFPHFSNPKLSIELVNNENQKVIEFKFYNSLNLNNYILPKLKYKNLKSCTLFQKNQFVDHYTTLAYLESVTSTSLEVVKFKINKLETKQILLITNENCLLIKKSKLPNKKVNDFILNATNVDHVGKIIIENNNFFTIQKGRPYLFPNCKTDKLNDQRILNYKVLPLKRTKNKRKITKNVFLNNFTRLKVLVETTPKNYKTNKYDLVPNFYKSLSKSRLPLKIKFSKMFLKKNGKLYSCMVPRFLEKFTIGVRKNTTNLHHSNLLKYQERSKLQSTLLMQSYEITSNNLALPRLTLVKFLEYPFIKTTKSVGLYSITEDFFEQDLNSVFCRDNQFIEDGETIGLLNLEKEITGDIVQGLPRIEEILEARKKNQVIKRIPSNKKKGLLSQKNSLDQNFEFHKIAVPIKENEKINPHKLLKVYFNYYGLLKPFFCDRQNIVKYARLIKNFEGSYKSFKKVQSFILNSVQGVYKSQGVKINDKHLEVIIKQMTTKVVITDEGDTPLLKREVIDLYHMEYMNKIMQREQKLQACYLPLLFGITRAALNNPSFISAASFQETTRVLTKAAIEGRMDWLRGLKENIIIGHLIPAGTGSRNYKNSFKKPLSLSHNEIDCNELIQT